ncbi:MAG: hypothetical protein ACRDLS_17725 [Solirubrobacteraceae bacterium]
MAALAVVSSRLSAPDAAAAAIGVPGPLVSVGPGASESSIRQAVRTPAGRVYIVAADDGGDAGTQTVLRMYRADQTGIPTSFSQADPAHAPSAPGGREVGPLGGGDARLDRGGTIHVAWYRRTDGTAVHQTFSTATDTWGPPETVTTTPIPADDENFGKRGALVTGMALDALGVPFVAVTGSGFVRVLHRDGSGSWQNTTLVSADGGADYHPSLTFDRLGRLHVAWLHDAGAATAIRYARRETDGTWSPVNETVAGSDVRDNSTLDQSPSIGVDLANRPVVLYLSATNDAIRTSWRADDGTWVADNPDPPVSTHTPGIYLRGNDRVVLEGHDIPGIDPAYISRLGSSSAWSSELVFASAAGILPSAREYDGSANARFDPLYDTDCNVIDAVFFDEDSDVLGGFYPDLYYASVQLPPIGCGPPAPPPAPLPPGGVGTRPPPPSGAADLTAPKLTNARLSRRRLRPGSRNVRLRFGLSEPATLRILVQRRSDGRWRNVAALDRRGKRGANSVRFPRRFDGQVLNGGRHRLRLSARDATGNRSRLTTIRFRVVPRR